jgi:L-rhamnose mutarotase
MRNLSDEIGINPYNIFLKIITKPILKQKKIQNDKIVLSWISNKSNVKRWNKKKKSITQNDLKKLGWKKN